MKVLVACEESQEVCMAFRERGHEAYSCDIQHCALYGHFEWHIVEKAEELINGNCCFTTVDGGKHMIQGKWDILIAHPPCTYLTAAGAVRLFNKDHTIKDEARLNKGKEAAELFLRFFNADCNKLAIENPVPMEIYGLPSYTQIIEPFMFGDPWRKRTCLWLKGLPPLIPTERVKPVGLWVGSTSARRDKQESEKIYLHTNRSPKRRSKTFTGIAKAMAEQWG